MDTFEGTITEKSVKATYWQIKLDIGNNRQVTLNTKDEGFWNSLKIGETGKFQFRESIIPNRIDDNGQPMKMKWILLEPQLIPKPDKFEQIMTELKEIKQMIKPSNSITMNEVELQDIDFT